jgi:hypothetical protein
MKQSIMVFKYNSINDFKDKIDSKDLEMSDEIFKQIKKAFNAKTKRKTITAFSVEIQNTVIDFTLNRDQWIKSLETCLSVFIEQEWYEKCAEIKKMMEVLESEIQ